MKENTTHFAMSSFCFWKKITYCVVCMLIFLGLDFGNIVKQFSAFFWQSILTAAWKKMAGRLFKRRENNRTCRQNSLSLFLPSRTQEELKSVCQTEQKFHFFPLSGHSILGFCHLVESLKETPAEGNLREFIKMIWRHLVILATWIMRNLFVFFCHFLLFSLNIWTVVCMVVEL